MVKNPPANPRDTEVMGSIPGSRKWQPTPVILPGKSQGQRNMAGYSPWDHKELDMMEHAPTTHLRKEMMPILLLLKFRR